MRNLDVFIEIHGKEYYVGGIHGNNVMDASFKYDDEYLNKGHAISVMLPLRKEAFSPSETSCFFEGLLPEGFSRKSVAAWLHADENDYLTGASGKVGLYYNEGRWFQPIGTAPSTHIVKQSHVRLKHIVENEQLSLRTAAHLGIPTIDSPNNSIHKKV